MLLKVTTFHQGIHLKQSDLLKDNSTCFFCSRGRLKRVSDIQADPLVFLFECQFCRAISVSRTPRQKTLKDYYKNYYEKNAADKITFDNPGRFIYHLKKDIDKRIIKKPIINVLDFGGGDGTISLALASGLLGNHQKANILVVDFANGKKSQTKNVKVKYADKLPSHGSFDLVLASAVLEHSTKPAQDLKKMFQLMAEGGVFYARTPYITPLKKLAKRFGVNIDFTYPSHLHDLGPDFWNKLLTWLPGGRSFKLLKSKPSIVETTLSGHFLRTLIAHILKAPWYLFKNKYHLIGGWEVFIQKNRKGY